MYPFKKWLRKILIFLMVILAILVLGFLKMYFIDEKYAPIGKNFTLTIPKDETIDYSKIDRTIPSKDGFGSEPWFDMWGSYSERQKLINYMKENKLKIKPGFYYINQADRFVKLKKIMQFEKIEPAK